MFDSRSRSSQTARFAQPSPDVGQVGFGIIQADEWLGGGLRRDGLHEFYGETCAATAFALLVAIRRRTDAQRILWLRKATINRAAQQPYGPGLAQLGIDPAALVLLRLPDHEALLRAATDSARHGGAAAILLEMDGRAPLLDLTASRRLALAAARSGTMMLVARNACETIASVAHSRWQVASAPSQPLPANAPGAPVFDLRLLRHRGGREGLHLQLEWNREDCVFRTPLPGRAPALSADRTPDRRTHRAA